MVFERVSFILILYVIFLIWVDKAQSLDNTDLNTKKLALSSIVLYVLGVESKTISSLESASSFCTFLWQKGISNHEEVYREKNKKSTVTNPGQ